jgi:muramoyltetrapeptide carboxypeptidase LdcA involved in peptidoglycan recycling
LHGIAVLTSLGFEVVEGSLTRRAVAEGYRAGSPRERAAELMELFADQRVRGIVTTIGGSNSSSLIPYLDFDVVRANPKVFCGYSDVTSLHLAFLTYAGLATFYGPAVVPSFGDWPTILPETRDAFLAATTDASEAERELVPPAQFSRHVRDARTSAWQTEPRGFEENRGPFAIVEGTVEGPCVVASLNTLLSAAGTRYFPPLDGRILIVEQMNAKLSQEERAFRHLEQLGAFEQVAALVVGKPEVYENEGAPFDYADLVREIVPLGRFPVVFDFDCGHTMPMFTIAQETRLRVEATRERTRVWVCEAAVV